MLFKETVATKWYASAKEARVGATLLRRLRDDWSRALLCEDVVVGWRDEEERQGGREGAL